MGKITVVFGLLISVLVAAGCKDATFFVPPGDTDQEGFSNDITVHSEFTPTICSELDFTAVDWPDELTDIQKNSLMLALNISGSFEGSKGWGNISDDFDDQGLSLGLLNQNLGQGSLQPLLLKMRDQNPETFLTLFKSDHYLKLFGMLDKWKGAPTLQMDFLLFSMDPKNMESAQWARQNLYAKKNFITDWKNEFVGLSTTQPYINLQLRTSLFYDSIAKEYLKILNLSQVRSYLTMFDIVVQNGGLNEDHFKYYWDWILRNPKATETDKLKKIILIRKPDVNPKWQADYMARKLAIFNRKGSVHGKQHDLEKEYCFDGLEVLSVN